MVHKFCATATAQFLTETIHELGVSNTTLIHSGVYLLIIVLFQSLSRGAVVPFMTARWRRCSFEIASGRRRCARRGDIHHVVERGMDDGQGNWWFVCAHGGDEERSTVRAAEAATLQIW